LCSRPFDFVVSSLFVGEIQVGNVIKERFIGWIKKSRWSVGGLSDFKRRNENFQRDFDLFPLFQDFCIGLYNVSRIISSEFSIDFQYNSVASQALDHWMTSMESNNYKISLLDAKQDTPDIKSLTLLYLFFMMILNCVDAT
jgi:hypothetical protein